MNGTMHKWLLKSLGSLSLASTVVLLPLLLTGCENGGSTGTVTPVPPPPPPPTPPAPPAPPPPPPTPTPAPTPTTAPSISALPAQVAALTPEGRVFSNTNVIPVGFGIRRAGAARQANVPEGTYSDFRAVLSFPIPDDIPRNAIVQEARLTLVQLPSDNRRGFFFLDPTPNNVTFNNVVLQEVTLSAPNNVTSSDFFAPASSPTFVALSINGNVLGGDVSAGPRTVDVRAGVQRAVSAQGPRFYQVRLQCAREVWNNQVNFVFPSVSTSVSTSVSGTASGNLIFQPTTPIVFAVVGTAAAGSPFYTFPTNNVVTATITLLPVNPITVSFSTAGSTFSAFLPTTAITITLNASVIALGISQSSAFVGPINTDANPSTASATLQTNPPNLNQLAPNRASTYSANVSASYSISTSVAGTPDNATGFEISQGAGGTCRAEFDRGGTGSTTGPRLDITFTVPR